MLLHRDNLTVLLLADDENPLWEAFRGSRISGPTIAKEMAVNDGSLSQWRRGGTVTAKSMNNVFKHLVSAFSAVQMEGKRTKLLGMINCYREAYVAGRPPVEMAMCLDYKLNDARRVLDQIYQITEPGLASVYEGTGKNFPQHTKDVLDLYKGTYDCVIKRRKQVLNAALQVRYALKIENGWAIRCKLHIPKVERYEGFGDTLYWEYDGFVSRRESALYWTFGQRGQNSDFFYMITDAGKNAGGDIVLEGSYLTTGQDDHRSIVPGLVKLTRRRNLSEADQELLMANVRATQTANA